MALGVAGWARADGSYGPATLGLVAREEQRERPVGLGCEDFLEQRPG